MSGTLPEADVMLVGLVDDGQRVDGISLAAQAVAAILEALLHGDADTDQRGAGLVHDVDEAAHGVALGHEVIDDEHTVIGVDPVLRNQQGHFLLIGVGKNIALVPKLPI